MSSELPLVTFALLAYNQERFVCEAVKGALAQTYSPLEIVLSDDCSSDATYELMIDAVQGYSGPHKLTTTRNLSNLGIGAHVDKLTHLARGELLVVAAGDDISLPNRVASLVEAWIDNGRRADSICSDVVVIDSDGVEVRREVCTPFDGELVKGVQRYFDGLQGATHAWTLRSYRVFGDMLPGTVCEDRVIPLRSALLGGVLHVRATLVKYRVHGANLSHHGNTARSDVLRRTASIHRRNANIHANYVKDIDRALGLGIGDNDVLTAAREAAKCGMALALVKAQFLDEDFVGRVKLVFRTARTFPGQAMRFAAMLVAPWLYRKQQLRNLGIE